SVASTTESQKVPRATIKVSLYVSVVSVVFLMTALIGIIVGYLTITNAQNTINNITDQLRSAIFDRCYQECQKTVDDTTKALSMASNGLNAMTVATNVNPTAPIGDAKLLWEYYQIGRQYPALYCIGMVKFNWGFQYNGKTNVQGALSVFTGLQPNKVQIIDSTTNFTASNRIITSSNSNGTLSLGPSFTTPFWGVTYVAATNPIWTKPTFVANLRTFLIPLMLPIWTNPAAAKADSAYFVTLSIANLDAFIRSVKVTPNGIVYLVDGSTGNMLAASLPDISQNVNKSSAYPSIGNPNALVSGSMTYLVSTFAVNATAGVFTIPKNETIAGKYNNGNDDILVNAAWIYDPKTNLRWFLVLAIPSNDFDAVIRETMRNSIITIVVICVSALALGLILSWLITAPLRKLTKSMEEATKFDFSALKEGFLKDRSYLTEIGVMQTVFNAMIVKFADAIKANASLKGSNAVTGSTQRKTSHV
ncbi:hypothetical protein HDU99_002171, partial [Rhizoclosmatium hyalinum]